VNYEGNNVSDEMNGAYYYHSDHLGSAQVVTNHAGNIYERFEYTPYGEVWIAWANSGVAHNEMLPFRFTGKELDEETGLYYYGARYLDPRVSRWLSADPALGDYLPSAPVNDEARRRNGSLPGMGGVFNYVNLHAYHYAGNNPVKYTDPDGRDVEIYDLSGNYIRTIESDTNHVYVQKPNIMQGYDLVQLQDIGVIEFNRVAALIYAEAAPNLDTAEQKGMGEVIYNRAKESGLSVNDVLDAPYSGFYGLGTDAYAEALTALESHEDPMGTGKASALRQAVAGTIDGFLGKGTIGAYFWNHPPAKPDKNIYETIKTINKAMFFKYKEDYKNTKNYGKEWP
jgi:RHS repeat-associated protein